MSHWFRRGLAATHRWSGLVLGLYLALVGFTGTLMVFQADLFELELGADKVGMPEGEGPWKPPAVWMQRAQEVYGPLENIEGMFGPGTLPIRLNVPSIIYDVDTPDIHGHGVVTFNPYTGEPMAHFVAEETRAMWALRLHNSLFLGEERAISAIFFVSVCATLFVITGLMLWWPRAGRWRPALKPASLKSPVGMRKSHTALGAWLSVFILFFAFTGLGLARFDLALAFAGMLGRVDGSIGQTNGSSCEPATPDDAWATALAEYPGSTVTMFLFPMAEGAPYSVYLRPAGATVSTRGTTEVRVDSQCGNVLFTRDTSSNRAGDTFLSYLVDLHNGRVLGSIGEYSLILVGLVIGAIPLLGMGAYLWRIRNRRKLSIDK